MARELYSNPSAILIEEIQNSVVEIDNIVTDLKNTDIAELSEKIENVDKTSNYKKFHYGYGLTSASANIWYELINIQGKGYIENALTIYRRANVDVYVEIYIDGVKKFDSLGANDATIVDIAQGIVNIKNLVSLNLSTSASGIIVPMMGYNTGFGQGVVNNQATFGRIKNFKIGTLDGNRVSHLNMPHVFLSNGIILFNNSFVMKVKVVTGGYELIGDFNGGLEE
jgi:hypothetical protein